MKEQDKKILIIYHKEDNDGVFSAAIILDFLVRNNVADEKHIELMGAEYSMLHDIYVNEEMPWQERFSAEKYKRVFLTDVSFNDIEIMKWLYETYKENFIWFDHHAPAIKSSFDNKYDGVEGCRLRDRSAIGCAWRYFHDPFDADWLLRKEYYEPGLLHIDRISKLEPGAYPELLRILSAYDSWTYKECGYDYDYVSAVNTGVNHYLGLDIFKVVGEVANCVNYMNSYSKQKTKTQKFDWLNWQNEDINFYLEKGVEIKDLDAKRWKNIISNMGDETFKLKLNDKEFYNAVMVFTSEPTNSHCFDSIKEIYPNVRFGIALKHNGKAVSKPYTLSLYDIYEDDNSFEDFHCGEFLKERYGGGGHKGAAGCQLSSEMFYMIMDNKYI